MFISTIHNVETNEFFYTKDHYQPHNLGPNWVHVTVYLPHQIVPRKLFESGKIETKEDYHKFLTHYGEIEIPNPDPNYV